VKTTYLASSAVSASIATKYASALAKAGLDVSILSAAWKDNPAFKEALEDDSTIPVSWFPAFGRSKFFRVAYYRGKRQLRESVIVLVDHPDLLPFALVNKTPEQKIIYKPFEYYTGVIYCTPELEARWRAIEDGAIDNIDLWVVPGVSPIELYCERGVERRRLEVVYNSITRHPKASVCDIREILGIGDDKVVVLYHGAVNPSRGLKDALDALPLLPDNVLFVFIPVGAFRDDFISMTDGISSERLRILDPVPEDQLVSFTRGADIGIIPMHPACVNYDTAVPAKVFQYLAAGLPMIVSRLSEITRFVEAHSLGLVHEPNNAEDLAKKIRQLVNDPNLRQQFARRATQLHSERICWEEQASKLRRVVLKCLTPIKTSRVT
jgi:glycosyltransferase involved in cell wall biosynthesis